MKLSIFHDYDSVPTEDYEGPLPVKKNSRKVRNILISSAIIFSLWCAITAYMSYNLEKEGIYHFHNAHFDLENDVISTPYARFHRSEIKVMSEYQQKEQKIYEVEVYSDAIDEDEKYFEGLSIIFPVANGFGSTYHLLIRLWKIVGYLHEQKIETTKHIFLDRLDILGGHDDRTENLPLMKIFFPNAKIHFLRDEFKSVNFEEVLYGSGIMQIEEENEYDHHMESMKKFLFNELGIDYSLKSQVSQPTVCYSEIGKRLNTFQSIDNGNEIFQQLKKKYSDINFVKFDFAEMDGQSFANKVEIASKCDVMFGTHGENLQLSIFMKKGSLLVEIFPEYIREKNIYHSGIYMALSGLAGVKYEKVYCEDVGEAYRPSVWHGALNTKCAFEDIANAISIVLEKYPHLN